MRRVSVLAAALLISGCMHPLHRAARSGDDDRVLALLSKGTDVDVRSGQKMTALMWAAYFGREGTVKLLLDRGTELNATDSRKRAALWYAATRGHLEVVKLLHKRGADASLFDALGVTAAQAAYDSGYVEVAAYLREATGGISRTDLQSVLAQAVEEAGFGKLSSKPRRVSDIDLPHGQLPPRPDDFAVIVGVEKYKALPDADYAARDAEAMRKHAQAIGFPRENIIYLVGPGATRGALASYFEEWLPRNAKPDSTVLVYFSGHGAPDVDTRESYLVPWDGDTKFLRSSAYPTQHLYGELAKLPAKMILVVLDACFSGSGGRSVLPQGARPLVTRVETGIVPQRMLLFAAAGGEEITSALEEQGHGIFTYYFLKGLGGAARDSSGNVTADGLYWYLKPLVQEAAMRQNRDQSPILQGAAVDKVIVRWPGL